MYLLLLEKNKKTLEICTVYGIKEQNRFLKIHLVNILKLENRKMFLRGVHPKLPANWLNRFAHLFMDASLLLGKKRRTIFKSFFRTLIYLITATVSCENNIATNKNKVAENKTKLL